MKPLALALVTFLSLSACGSEPTINSTSSGELDRSNVEEVAVAFLTAFIESNMDTVRSLALPDQREEVATLERAAELGRRTSNNELESVDVAATVVEEDDTTATVHYSGEYCLTETTTEITATSVEPDPEGAVSIPETTRVVTEPEQCFNISEYFGPGPGKDGIQIEFNFELIDGEWYVRLPE